MNPGLVVKLRPSGPWRIGPDSGARNRVDFVYHSDSLYSAITSAMARLGSLDEWLNATARDSAPAVCFGSCFPFLDEIGFVVPPRTIWPPTSPSSLSARVRWKSAKFVPLGIVHAILAGQHLDENQWAVDGASECLVPAGRPGPFRMGVRWSAAIDRLTGSAERHSTACVEFRAGAGLWTVVSFRDQAARDQWSDRVKAAFRLLADTGFGGERSRGWGRAEAPEFVEGALPDMILPEAVKEAPVAPPVQEPPEQVPPAEEPPMPVSPKEEPPEKQPPAEEPPAETEEEIEENRMTAEGDPQLPTPDPDPDPIPPPPDEPSEPSPDRPPGQWPLPPDPVLAPVKSPAYWLLSLFTPAAEDTVDWARGNYSVMARGGRVESPTGSGELKKQLQMVTEGSVLYSHGAPRGSAPDVAPDGFAHPVFRAGFALTIPLPGGEGNT